MSSAGLWPLPLPSLLCSLPSGWGRRKGQGSNWTVPRAPYLSQTAYCETNNCSKNCSGAYVIPWRALTGVRHPQIPDAGHLQLFDILLELPSEGSTLQTHALWTPSLMVHLVFFRLLLDTSGTRFTSWTSWHSPQPCAAATSPAYIPPVGTIGTGGDPKAAPRWTWERRLRQCGLLSRLPSLFPLSSERHGSLLRNPTYEQTHKYRLGSQGHVETGCVILLKGRNTRAALGKTKEQKGTASLPPNLTLPTLMAGTLLLSSPTSLSSVL